MSQHTEHEIDDLVDDAPQAHPSPGSDDSTEVDSTEVDSTEVDSTEVDSTEVDSTEVDSTEVDSTEVDSTEVDSTEVDGTDADDDGTDADDAVEPPRAGDLRSRLVEEGDIAGDYLEGLLDIVDLDGDLDLDVEGDRAVVSIEGGDGDLSHLVGRDGEVLDALQELTRLAVLRETGERSRLMLDIDGHRARRRVELTERGTRAAEESRSSGQPVTLPPMNPFERKVVHDAVAAAGLVSESEGVEPMRYVVVRPA